MESKKIKEVLRMFEENDTYKKIFINGPWGIGKSYFTEEYVKEKPNNKIYVSLFGKSSFESIEDSIAIELMNKLSKMERTAKQVKEFIKRFKGSISYKGMSLNSPAIEKKSLFQNYSKLLKNEKLIIIIDDIERKSSNVQIEDIMGLIEQFSLYENVKIVIIGAEDNMQDDDKKKWKDFKEKIIEKEYKITSFSEEAIESIVVGKLKKYVPTKELKEFINTFLEKHKTSNLRSIEKGVKLFLEVTKSYLNKKQDSKIYTSILKNCMAVSIEFNEELYKPKELTEKEKQDLSKSMSYLNDEEMYSRIITHYFHSIFIVKKESAILENIISFYTGEINEAVINDFNSIIENYMNKKEEKSIYYLSEEEIIGKIKERYKLIEKDSYEFSTLEETIEDFNEVLKWNNDLKIGLDSKIISKKFNEIIFENYYSIEKEMHENRIDTFNIMRYNSKELDAVIKKYNEECSKRYSEEKLSIIINEYKEKLYNTNKLQWLDWSLIQEDKDNIKSFIMNKFKKHNYLIPDLSNEITEDEWKWTYNIWKIYYDRLSTKEKMKINKEVEKMKTNLLATSRIESLQNYRPLVEKSDGKKTLNQSKKD